MDVFVRIAHSADFGAEYTCALGIWQMRLDHDLADLKCHVPDVLGFVLGGNVASVRK